MVKLGSKNKKHLRGSTRATMLPLATILTAAFIWALVSTIDSLGEYCDPHTASSVCLISLLLCKVALKTHRSDTAVINLCMKLRSRGASLTGQYQIPTLFLYFKNINNVSYHRIKDKAYFNFY